MNKKNSLKHTVAISAPINGPTLKLSNNQYQHALKMSIVPTM